MKPKLNSNVLTFLAVFISVIVWNEIGPQVSSAVFLLLDAPHVFPRVTIALVVSLLPLILLFEVVTKQLLLRSIPDTLVYEPTQLETLPGINSDALNIYTRNLEALGFTKLYDYKLVESVIVVARLFFHAEHHCFADIYQLIGSSIPMSCNIVSILEQDWTLATTDRPKSSISAVAYAFLRQPRSIGRYESGAEPQPLLQSHLALRQQMMADLHLQVLPDVSTQAFFDATQRGRTRQKQAMGRRSVLFALVEMLLFSLNPKTEWLGEYAALAAQHRQR